MIVVDLDGTIINQDKKISVETKRYLKLLKDRGYIIVIATGRIYELALHITEGAEFANYILSDTGACIYDVTKIEPIFQTVIDKKTLEKIFEYYNNDFVYLDICTHHRIYRYSDTSIDNELITTIKDKTYILNHCKEVSHISIGMKNNEMVMELYEQLVKEIPNLDVLIMQDSYSDKKWIEAMPKGTSKYHSIKRLATYLGIDNTRIMAFGDGLNDIEMLQKCGYGVALKNALPQVKKVANDITRYDYNHDGVVEYLKEYLDIKL